MYINWPLWTITIFFFGMDETILFDFLRTKIKIRYIYRDEKLI